MGWRRRDPQPFLTDRNGWIVDRLNVDMMPLEKVFAHRSTKMRIANQHGDKMTLRAAESESCSAQEVLQPRCVRLLAFAQRRIRLQLADRGKSASGEMGTE